MRVSAPGRRPRDLSFRRSPPGAASAGKDLAQRYGWDAGAGCGGAGVGAGDDGGGGGEPLPGCCAPGLGFLLSRISILTSLPGFTPSLPLVSKAFATDKNVSVPGGLPAGVGRRHVRPAATLAAEGSAEETPDARGRGGARAIGGTRIPKRAVADCH